MKKNEYSNRFNKITVLITAIFFSTMVCFVPMGSQAVYTPPVTISAYDVIAVNVDMMIVYPHFGTPVFIEPGQTFTAQVATDSTYGTNGWTAWVENDYQKWDCTVGTVAYGIKNIYLDTKAGYTIPITVPSNVSPELCTLVIQHGEDETLRSPMSVSIVPTLNTSFYTGGLTDTHFMDYYRDDKYGNNMGKSFGLMAKALTLGGARFLSHTGDICLAGDVTRAVGNRDYCIQPLVQWGKVPFIQAPGNHERDSFVEPGPAIVTGTRIANFAVKDYERYYGMRSQVMMMGSFAVVKHDFSAYGGDGPLRNAIAAKWNAITGATYRLLLQHSHGGEYTPLFSSVGPQVIPAPSPYPNLELKGHDHAWAVSMSSPFLALSLGGGGWDGGTGTMFNFNYNAGTWSCPQATSSFGIANKMSFVQDCTTGQERNSLRDSFSKTNDGSATSNVATITNDMIFNYFDGRERFIMAKGNYSVTGGTKLSQYDSADGTKTIVLVRVNIPTGDGTTPGTATVSITSITPPPTPTPSTDFTPAAPLVISKPIIKVNSNQVNALPSSGIVYTTAHIADSTTSAALPNTPVTILVYKGTDVNGDIVHVKQTVSDKNGNAFFSFVPDAGTQSGTYTVVVGGDKVGTSVSKTVTSGAQGDLVSHPNASVQSKSAITSLSIDIPSSNNIAIEIGYKTTAIANKDAVITVAQYSKDGALVALKLTNATFLASQTNGVLPTINVPYDQRVKSLSIMAFVSVDNVIPLYYKTTFTN